ncbi:MAG: helix-turn-helix domain-containing protein [Candidatus Brocadiae bacterium]|nr:helix-turn-helix domain-containing protein [Candidatus Brocadiia bacterium]
MALQGFLTTAEAAKRLGLARTYVYYLIKDGQLKAVRVGARMLLVDAESVRKFRPRPRGRPRKKGKSSMPPTRRDEEN